LYTKRYLRFSLSWVLWYWDSIWNVLLCYKWRWGWWS